MREETRKFYGYFQREGFSPVNKDSYSIFKAYEQYSMLQEMGATIITAWSFAYNGLYKIIHGYLCSVYFYEGKNVYFALHRPLEPPEYSLRQIIDILYDLSMNAGLPSFQIKFIEERFIPEFQAVEGYAVKTAYFRDDCDYIYRNDEFIDLDGTINANKRKRINKCLKDKRISFKDMTNKNIGICLDIEEYWCQKKDCSYCSSFSGCEKNAMKIMADIFDDRIYRGMFLCIDGDPSGYIIGEVINEKIAFAYFGKSLDKDHFVYCMYMMAKNWRHNAEYVNCNEDMGNMGIRVFKSHLGKYSLWNKYICEFKKKQ
ncbi:MAG: phosphatidylglycerol lysyltransferase domain-containing protein [Treponema sp.]|jgi:hypothetical protein|nr:phosphatidylglycerol lysyltransferase domain-containing protein [Treponema sp.]